MQLKNIIQSEEYKEQKETGKIEEKDITKNKNTFLTQGLMGVLFLIQFLISQQQQKSK